MRLVIGASGMIGSALMARYRRLGVAALGTVCTQPTPGDMVLRLEDAEAIPLPEGVETAYICTGISRIAACEADPAGTRSINVDKPLHLARRLTERGARVIGISSTLVLDGDEPFCPADTPYRPTTEYGRQKRGLETGLRALGERAMVVRISKVLPAPANSIFSAWRAALRAQTPVTALADRRISPVAMEQVVDGLIALETLRTSSILQFSAPDEISWADAARVMAGAIGADPALVSAQEQSGDHAGLPARHASLDIGETTALLGWEFWDSARVLTWVEKESG